VEEFVDGSKRKEDLEGEGMKFGKIAIIPDLGIDGEDIYNRKIHSKAIKHIWKMPTQSEDTFLYLSRPVYLPRSHEQVKGKRTLKKISVKELLLEFSKVYIVTDGQREIVSEVPKKVEDLAEKLRWISPAGQPPSDK